MRGLELARRNDVSVLLFNGHDGVALGEEYVRCGVSKSYSVTALALSMSSHSGSNLGVVGLVRTGRSHR